MLKLLFLIALLMAYSTAKAVDYRVVCDVKNRSANRTASTSKILLELDIEPRYFKHFIQEGKTFKRLRDGFPYDVDDKRILITNDGVTQEYYDTLNKKYFYKNDASGEEVSGECVPAPSR